MPYEHPSLRARAEGHAGHDHLPGPGDRGGDGVRRLLARRGGGAAPGDEPQALRRGDRGLPPALHRRRGRHPRRGRRGGRARLRDDRRLLRLRLPQGPRRRVRPARLPVDLAARALRPGVPVRAAQRAADGLLRARHARPRGPAPRDRAARPGRQRERRGVHGGGTTAAGPPAMAARGRRRSRGGAARARLRPRGARRRRSRRSSPPGAEGGPFRSLADLASRAGAGRPALEKLAWAGACDALAGGSSEHARRAGAVAARRRLAGRAAAERDAARAAARGARGAGAAAARAAGSR